MNNTINLNSSTREVLFHFGWTLFLSTLILDLCIFSVNSSIITFILKGIRYISYLLCIWSLIFKTIRIRELPILTLFVIGFLLSGISSQTTTFPLYGIVLLSSIDINIDKTIKITAFIQGFYLFFIILLSQVGIIQDYIFGSSDNRYRHGLGFNWTTTAPMLYLFFCLCLLYIYRKKRITILIVLMQLFNVWLFYMTDSRLIFYLLTLILIFFMYQQFNSKKWKLLSKLKIIYLLMPFLMFMLTIYVVKNYDWFNPTWASVDRLLSHRLGLSQSAYTNYGVHLLGQPIRWVGNSYRELLLKAEQFNVERYNYVDNSYLQLMFNNGLLFLLEVLTIYTYGIYKALKKRNYHLIIIYCTIMVLSLTEPRLMNLAFNPFPIIALGSFSEKFYFVNNS